jgi:ribosome-associated translation inhibitor RaiA
VETPLQVTFRNIQTSDWLEGKIRERAGRLERFHHSIIACRVVVELAHKSAGSGKNPIALSIEVEVPSRTLISKAQEEVRETKGDTGTVVTKAFEAMERQLEEDARMRKPDVKPHDSSPELGRVARLYPDQNYGFIEVAEGPDLYFTENALHGFAIADLTIGMPVAITKAQQEGPMGPQASSVRRIGEEQKMR